MDYKSSGVDIEAGDALVDWLVEEEKKPIYPDRLVSGIGGFASLFRIQFPQMESPCLVTSTDGIGTKVKLASYFQQYETVGQDLVGMCVNDLLCVGAQPLIFLDYFATSKLDLDQAKAFLKGLKRACQESLCDLVGGETAEMPGVYQAGDFDCAGFAVGVVDEKKRLGPHRVRIGDRVLGIASAGFHSNGYSLLRKVFEKDLDAWKQTLMTPTALYARIMAELHQKGLIEAAAHITGGGVHNIPRVLPENTALKLQKWTWPEPFVEVQKRTGLSEHEMLKVLNCGVGMAVILRPENWERAVAALEQHGHRYHDLGVIVESSGPSEVLF